MLCDDIVSVERLRYASLTGPHKKHVQLASLQQSKNIKIIILIRHQDIANTSFIRLQLRQTSGDRVQSDLILFFLFSSPYL